jgi:hypothetical protein
MSIFNKNLHFPVPLLAFERLSEIENKDEPILEILEILISVCNVSEPVEDDVAYFLNRHQEYTSPPKKDDEEEDEEPYEDEDEEEPRKTRGSDFHEFIRKLDKATALLMAVNYDYEKAESFYCKKDFTVADLVIQTFIEMTTQTYTYLYESMIYAFGGSYPDDKKEETNSKITPLGSMSATEFNKLSRGAK